MTLASKWRVRCLAVTLLFSPLCIAQSGEPFLATLPIERAADATMPLGARVLFSLQVNDPESLAPVLSEVNGIEVLSVNGNSVQILAAESPTASAAVAEKFLVSSFVVDFEEAAVHSLLENVRQKYGPTPSANEIATFVFNHVSNKTYSRSFDLASRVAARGEGDCTEHAVLLTALARALGLYARIVFGALVIEKDSKLYAYGHAWTEIYDGGTWQIMDATLPGSDLERQHLHYLPIGVLDDEGPGYFLSLFRILDSLPSKITAVANRG